MGLWFRENVPPDSLLATNTAGSVAYYSRLKTIDMLGLNDVHIAHREVKTLGKGFAGHEKGDGKYVLSRKPDYVMFVLPQGAKTHDFQATVKWPLNQNLGIIMFINNIPYPPEEFSIYTSEKNRKYVVQFDS